MAPYGEPYNNMKNYFPAQGKNYTYLQTNRSDDLGSIWSSMGIDLQSNLGTMRVAPRLKINTSTTDDAQLGLPIAFEHWDTAFWAVCGGSVFKNGSSPNAVFTEDASAGAVTTYDLTSDLEVFDSRLWATAPTALYSKAGNGAGTGAWTARGGGLSASTNHPLVYFHKFERLYYTGQNRVIYSINAANTESTSGDYTLTLGSTINCMRATSNYIWIGTAGSSSNESPFAFVYQWDGISAQVTNRFITKSNTVVAMTVDNDIPYIMDSNGILSRFNGSSFQEIGRLPYPALLPRSVFVIKNGMIATKNNTILVAVNNLNADNVGTYNENVSSGVWEWSEEFGFVHKYSFTYNPSANSTITDYGQNRVSAIGAVFDASTANQIAPVSGSNGSILVGATYFTNASSTNSAIFFDDSNDTVQKKGYFVTTWFNSSEIEDKWTRLWETYRRLLSSIDSIVFKYRIHEENPTYADITWTSTTTFTTTTDVTAYGPTATGFNGTTGGEVEIMQGTGGASCAHITSIVNNAGTYTVTLDTVVTGATGTAKARFQKWIKLLPEITGQIKSYEQQAIGANNIRIQIKGCMTFTGNGEFFKLALFSNEDIKINA